MEYYSGSVSPESMIYITRGVNQGLIFLVVYFKAKLEQFIQNLLKIMEIIGKLMRKLINNLNGYIASSSHLDSEHQSNN